MRCDRELYRSRRGHSPNKTTATYPGLFKLIRFTVRLHKKTLVKCANTAESKYKEETKCRLL